MILKGFDTRYVTFEKNEPQNNSYKIVILDEVKAEKQIKTIEHQGFNFVANFKEFYIFTLEEKFNRRRPNLSGEMLGFTIKWFDKQIKKQVIGLIVSIFIIILLSIFLLYNNLFAIGLVKMDNNADIFYGSIFSFGFFQLIREVFLLSKLKKYFYEHKQYLRTRSFILSKIGRTIAIIFIFVNILGPGLLIYLDYKRDIPVASVSEIYESMPIVLIQDVENENGVKGQLLETQKEVDLNGFNYVELKSTLLSQNQYRGYQTYAFNDNRGSMRMEYYEVAGKNFARLLTREISKKEADEKIINNLDFKGLDKVYLSQGSSEKNISVCKGKRVMSIRYNGDQPAEKVLEEMAEVL